MAGELTRTRELDAGPPQEQHSLELALIGNCQIGALVDPWARILWACFPRFDGDPRFCALLDDDDQGYFAIDMIDCTATHQHYLRNTAILRTVLTDVRGAKLEIIDFAPRFKQYSRHFRPEMLVRRVRALEGAPMLRVRVRPATGYGEEGSRVTRGSNHIRYIGGDHVLRLTTDAPITHVLGEHAFVLDGEMTLLLGPDESLTESVGETGRRFFDQTQAYWLNWVRALGIPFEWQHAVLRAAITLKLSTFEDTGAVIAAMTTSIPEIPDSTRNWDYRYCWLRDAYFVVHALNRLGATLTMERYLGYIINVAACARDHRLQPLYGIGGETRLIEGEVGTLAGYRGMGPVRVGNDAFHQDQHDIYGAVVLAATQAFFDERLARPGDKALFHELEKLGEHAAALYDVPDAGIWEYRGRKSVHTYSSVMCWAACDRLAHIAERLGAEDRRAVWRERADTMHATICERAYHRELNAFVESFDGDGVDASLLLLHALGFLSADDPRFVGTVELVERKLRRGDHIFRYIGEDDFGQPANAFNICTFWYIEALAAIGRQDEARRLFENMLEHRTALGLMSEDLDPQSGELWGNFPQTYSMVGLINAAMRLSRRWEDAF